MKCLPRAVAARERARRGLPHVTDAKSINETLERNLASRADRPEQVTNRRRAVTLDLFELELFPVARFQREDVGRLLEPALLKEIIDLLFAEPVDVEGAARHEKLQVLGFLERTGDLAGAAKAHALLAGRI